MIGVQHTDSLGSTVRDKVSDHFIVWEACLELDESREDAWNRYARLTKERQCALVSMLLMTNSMYQRAGMMLQIAHRVWPPGLVLFNDMENT